ncbi:MAG: ABC transporter substrate-binding protein [Anaerolineales bacterium]|nr:ABC transporter substrate-binding protein [Anaerolineales bacterium]
MKSKVHIPLALLIVLLAISAACAGPQGQQTPGSSLDHVHITMGFRPDIQFAPLYVMIEEGFAEEEEIEIEITHLPETEAVQLVGVDELQFAIVSGEQVLLARAQGLPIVYVMAWWQDYPVAVAAPQGSGINTPSDFKGKRIGIPGLYGASYIGFRALLTSGNFTEDDVQLDAIGYTQVEALSQGLEDAVVIYANNEPIQLAKLGISVNVIRVADYVHLASNGLITNEKTLRENPDLVRRMVSAFTRGVAATMEDPEHALEVSKRYVDGLDAADQSVQLGILETSIEFWKSENLGHSDQIAWENMQQVLLDMGLLEVALDVEEAYTNEFVE